jgi:hypothetical protein
MKPVSQARLQSRCSRGFTLACNDDAHPDFINPAAIEWRKEGLTNQVFGY